MLPLKKVEIKMLPFKKKTEKTGEYDFTYVVK